MQMTMLANQLFPEPLTGLIAPFPVCPFFFWGGGAEAEVTLNNSCEWIESWVPMFRLFSFLYLPF